HRARIVLDGCPKERRGWEWHYLKRLCHAERLNFTGHSGEIQALALSPDKLHVASSDGDVNDPATPGEILYWEFDTGKVIQRIRPKSTVTSLAFHPKGQYLAAGSIDGKLTLWEIATQRVVFSVPAHVDGQINAIAFAPDGRFIATGGYKEGGPEH